jgi:Ca-activated chloride channel homolog
MRPTRLLGVLVLVGCSLATARLAGLQEAVFRETGDTVRVFATVTDRSGRLVTSLTRDDFEIRDDGRPQPITLFDNTPQPVRIVVMLDVSGSMEGNLGLLRASAEQLFRRLGPDDLARVGTFGHTVEIDPAFTRDLDTLRAALPTAIAPDAPTPLWRAVDEAMSAFGDEGEERRVVLVLSDGKDSGPIGFRQRYVSQAEVIDRARDDDVMIYAIGMHSRGQPRRLQPGIGAAGLQAMLTADLPDPGLARVAQESGGGYLEIRPNHDLGAAFAQVVEELHAQYLLGFEPKRDGRTHRIDVRVGQRGLTARARRSYVAPRD